MSAHRFDSGYTSLSVQCNQLVLDKDGSATTCGKPREDEIHDLCIECGDHKGWRVEPDPATGDAVQVQCRACSEHICPGSKSE